MPVSFMNFSSEEFGLLGGSMYRGQLAKLRRPAGSWFSRPGSLGEAPAFPPFSFVPDTPHAASNAWRDIAPAPMPMRRSNSLRLTSFIAPSFLRRADRERVLR